MATSGEADSSDGSDSSSRPFSLASLTQQQSDNMKEFRGMSEEELAVMKECQRESLYLRAMPLAAGAMLGASMMFKTGRWSPHPKFGPYPKMLASGFTAFFVGKLMYVPVCQQKILDQIPNSNLAQQINKSRNRGRREGGDLSLDAQKPFMKSGDDRQTSELPLPPQKTEPGLDDRFRPSMNNDVKKEETPEAKRSLTYEELRRKNRQEYDENLKKRTQDPKEGEAEGRSYKDSPFMPQKPWPSPDIKRDSKPEAPPGQAPEKRKRTNMWGDVIDD